MPKKQFTIRFHKFLNTQLYAWTLHAPSGHGMAASHAFYRRKQDVLRAARNMAKLLKHPVDIKESDLEKLEDA